MLDFFSYLGKLLFHGSFFFSFVYVSKNKPYIVLLFDIEVEFSNIKIYIVIIRNNCRIWKIHEWYFLYVWCRLLFHCPVSSLASASKKNFYIFSPTTKYIVILYFIPGMINSNHLMRSLIVILVNEKNMNEAFMSEVNCYFFSVYINDF